jgi:hypothetical protein
MNRKTYIGLNNIIIVILLVPLIFPACVGPKFMSGGGGDTDLHINIPYKKDLSVRVTAFLVNKSDDTWNNKLAGELFTEILIGKIREKNLFSNIIVKSVADSAEKGLLLDLNMEDIMQAGYSGRSSGKISGVYVKGRLIDVEEDETLFLIGRGRVGHGGLFGISGSTGIEQVTGLFTASEKKMIRQLIEWLAEDITEILEKGIKK